MRLPVSILLLISTLGRVMAAEDDVFLWSATGGGWRAQFACVGYANVFQQAGLFTQTSSKFQAIVSLL